MAQHDFILDNQQGLSFRADLNAVLQAIVTNNSGTSAPTTTYPGQFWLDTSTNPGVLKRRNDANNGWIDVTASPSFSGTLTHTGDIVLSGSGKRITGDFSHATAVNRISFLTSTTNGNTLVDAIPNGTATKSQFLMWGSTTKTNTAVGLFSMDSATALDITSDKVGTGSYVPLNINVGGALRMRFGATGGITCSTPATPSSGTASISATGTFSYDPTTHGQVCTLTATNAITITLGAAAGKFVANTHYTLMIKAGNTSARTFAKNSTVKGSGGNLPITSGATTANSMDVFHLVALDANTVMIVGSSADVR